MLLDSFFEQWRKKNSARQKEIDLLIATRMFNVIVKGDVMYITCEGRAVELIDNNVSVGEVIKKLDFMRTSNMSYNNEKSIKTG